jgi:hypothetical protein
VLQGDEKPMLAAALRDPGVGLYSPTASNKSAVLDRTFYDAVRARMMTWSASSKRARDSSGLVP